MSQTLMSYVPTNDIQAAKALGWFSIGLGMFELVAARAISHRLGLRQSGLVRAFGVRELAAGMGILGKPDAPAALWARVGGDALDLLVLAPALSRRNRRREAAVAATLMVAGVTVADILCALALISRSNRALRTAQRTRLPKAA